MIIRVTNYCRNNIILIWFKQKSSLPFFSAAHVSLLLVVGCRLSDICCRFHALIVDRKRYFEKLPKRYRSGSWSRYPYGLTIYILTVLTYQVGEPRAALKQTEGEREVQQPTVDEDNDKRTVERRGKKTERREKYQIQVEQIFNGISWFLRSK